MRYGIQLYRHLDAAGRPVSDVVEHEMRERATAETALQDVYRYIRNLEPARTDRRGVYRFRDPALGSGELVVLGLSVSALERLEERVQIHELEQAIGMRDPYLWDRHAPGSRRAWRNPWVSTVIAAVFALIGLVVFALALGFHGQPDRDPMATWVGAGGGLLIGGLGVFLLLFNVRRIQWWTRARAAVRAAGLPMPSDLHLFE